ncbi:hypothetical protein BDP27DRAFT_1416195 [Rhodocollybia butyracea]|uniref:Uncharacterized protein n=1 Tax=Rhodocollybia butyracea TaxID=206335 RepID=A0A9P5Q579_9AGAR|nr:hypothetical protein BDP27DRAFT_1416195 [Rhodocollybia butyracea]
MLKTVTSWTLPSVSPETNPASRASTPLSTSAGGNRPKRLGKPSVNGNSTPLNKYPPKLTNNERALLDNNSGCRKCHQFFVECRTYSDSHEFPAPTSENYHELTQANVDAARRRKGKSKSSVAAVINSSNVVSAVLEGTDSEDKISVSPAPYKLPHFRWRCHVSGPRSEFPLTVRPLLDDGAHLALIHPDLVDCLGLKCMKLDKPEPVSSAFSSKDSSLMEFVSFKLSSLNGSFTSHLVPFLVAPSLCTQIILGLPWLSHNKLVIDYSTHTCTHRPSGYDLLNPVVPSRAHIFESKNKTTLKTDLKKMDNRAREVRQVLIHELKSVCAMIRLTFPPERVKVDMLAAVKECIEGIALLEKLRVHEEKLKDKYRPIFEPIPHVEDLPSSVTAKIQIINATKTIAACSYRCPKKF